MKTWLAKDARAHFADIVPAALEGELQRVTRRGGNAVVAVSEGAWQRLHAEKPSKTFGQIISEFPLTRRNGPKESPDPCTSALRRSSTMNEACSSSTAM